MIRIGTVVATRENEARVHFAEDDMVSDWLRIVSNSENPKTISINDTVLCVYRSDNFNADGYVIGVI